MRELCDKADYREGELEMKIIRITKMEQPTNEQIQRLKALMAELGYDFEDYPIENMSREDVADLIDEMRDELYG